MKFKGYTLIETLVAVSIGSMVLMMIFWALLSYTRVEVKLKELFASNRKKISTQSTIHQLVEKSDKLTKMREDVIYLHGHKTDSIHLIGDSLFFNSDFLIESVQLHTKMVSGTNLVENIQLKTGEQILTFNKNYSSSVLMQAEHVY